MVDVMSYDSHKSTFLIGAPETRASPASGPIGACTGDRATKKRKRLSFGGESVRLLSADSVETVEVVRVDDIHDHGAKIRRCIEDVHTIRRAQEALHKNGAPRNAVFEQNELDVELAMVIEDARDVLRVCDTAECGRIREAFADDAAQNYIVAMFFDTEGDPTESVYGSDSSDVCAPTIDLNAPPEMPSEDKGLPWTSFIFKNKGYLVCAVSGTCFLREGDMWLPLRTLFGMESVDWWTPRGVTLSGDLERTARQFGSWEEVVLSSHLHGRGSSTDALHTNLAQSFVRAGLPWRAPPGDRRHWGLVRMWQNEDVGVTSPIELSEWLKKRDGEGWCEVLVW